MNLKIMNFQVGGFLIYFLGVRQLSPIGYLKSILKVPMVCYGTIIFLYLMIN